MLDHHKLSGQIIILYILHSNYQIIFLNLLYHPLIKQVKIKWNYTYIFYLFFESLNWQGPIFFVMTFCHLETENQSSATNFHTKDFCEKNCAKVTRFQMSLVSSHSCTDLNSKQLGDEWWVMTPPLSPSPQKHIQELHCEVTTFCHSRRYICPWREFSLK